MRHQHGIQFSVLTLASVLTIASGCAEEAKEHSSSSAQSGSASSEAPDDKTDSPVDLIARGERIYNINCIACHHRDPTQDGGLGPPIAGSSRELLEARVLRGEYPPGYTPKTDTKLMIPLPHLEPEIDALTAFLASRAK